MNDILFGNNNQGAIKRLAKRNYRANKQRNFFVTVALFLTAFMITSVFSLGCSYFETFQMQQIRAMGTTADVAITNLTKKPPFSNPFDTPIQPVAALRNQGRRSYFVRRRVIPGTAAQGGSRRESSNM